MRQVKIVRVETDANNGTFGALILGGEMFCITLEPYSRDNALSVSCIPTGQYTCRRYSSSKYKNTFEVSGVQDRTKILFHAGNIDEHTAGCILLGEKIGKLKGDRAVLNSGKTFDKFLSMLSLADEFKLTIVECF